MINTVCMATAIAYTVALFWPALETIRLWLVAIPVLIAFIAILAIGAWMGWTMATTAPPKPIEGIQMEETEEEKKRVTPSFLPKSIHKLHVYMRF